MRRLNQANHSNNPHHTYSMVASIAVVLFIIYCLVIHTSFLWIGFSVLLYLIFMFIINNPTNTLVKKLINLRMKRMKRKHIR
ncbi:MAG: hypothetical protein H9901_00235 [Candidatus Paralactobacillus gallistercoris]|uniref:Uncharacterized protein n=1 Tax=Candidatus Paralactobacillus gallistercoris TaxID=2838724 RepID=A0A948X2F4_9LACO|nr:hypothetical protein [Candidatus Paralactobacillus gallistercoris]